jgi:hypothetical protein
VKDRWKAGTTIIVSSAISYLVLDSGIVVPSRAQWITCSMEKQVLGILNIYAPNKGSERASFWNHIANNIPIADSWIVGRDFNMVERESSILRRTLTGRKERRGTDWL